MAWQVDWSDKDGKCKDSEWAQYLTDLIEIVRKASADKMAFFISIQKIDEEE